MAQDITTASVSGLNIERKTDVIERNTSKVLCRLFMQGGDPARIKKTIQRVVELDDEETEILLNEVLDDFSERHRNLEDIFYQNFHEISVHISSVDYSFKRERELLIGAYFTMEYAVESAALFNPSIVPHPDQTGVPDGSLRFIMSLRAVGEGHLSSVVFRSGIINENGDLSIDPSSDYATQPKVENPVYKKTFFDSILKILDGDNEVSAHILEHLSDEFTHNELEEQMAALSDKPKFSDKSQLESFEDMSRLADSNYDFVFDSESNLSERVIFPVAEDEKGGIEDARFIPFQKDNGDIIYFATFTAYDGSNILPQLIETKDFIHFKIRTLSGDAVRDKDMALFPRKINGRFAMLGRQDGVNIHIMFSENIRHWDESEILQEPSEPWELIQMGTCAPPIETSQGWLVLTHGVGPMRAYSIGAILLDLEDPTKIIKRLKTPLLKALEQQRVGYVPNVVYTCGALLHKDQLIIPYALSDIQPAIARVKLDDLLDAMY